MEDKNPPGQPRYDAVYVHSLREAAVIVVMFSIACVWAISVSFSTGYNLAETDEVATVLGMPAWVFYAVLLPWVVIDVVAIWFCFFYMQNDDLGEAVETAAYEFGEDEVTDEAATGKQNPPESQP